ncbi:tryptophan--tRNA ligase [Mycoplasma sp. Ms02]|uniref:tryptophan--tRNA ligase n=1 Tax=Mycoplasma sp. Ms02 TaxID=353851 RepID=UPI001C8A1D1E|nr:tryptophan--tRNA ligase [Mycoplasma sp. Ms02]QZE12216.1 tryptophan--tRNA ligase [Mycoplasma sp. Ms02]
MKQRIVSGIKPTGDLTLGNYIGAIKSFIKLQDQYNSFIFVADLHALTMNDTTPKELYKKRKEIVALYLACGLDPQKATIFYQSDVYEHGMLQWLLTCETSLGELNRMTQFKDKSQAGIKQANGTEKIPTGLLMYPVLMAGDILLYNPEVVPIGEDQQQHLELTRNLAQRMNAKYKTRFKIPEPFVPEVGARIKSLTNPLEKMSKSAKSQKATIYLLDKPEDAYKKIQKAVTDSENKVYISNEKPGVLNLLTIFASLKNMTLKEAENHFKEADYKTFKHEVGLAVQELLQDIQDKYQQALAQIDSIAAEGAKKAKTIAEPILNEVMKKMGFKE